MAKLLSLTPPQYSFEFFSSFVLLHVRSFFCTSRRVYRPFLPLPLFYSRFFFVAMYGGGDGIGSFGTLIIFYGIFTCFNAAFLLFSVIVSLLGFRFFCFLSVWNWKFTILKVNQTPKPATSNTACFVPLCLIIISFRWQQQPHNKIGKLQSEEDGREQKNTVQLSLRQICTLPVVFVFEWVYSTWKEETTPTAASTTKIFIYRKLSTLEKKTIFNFLRFFFALVFFHSGFFRQQKKIGLPPPPPARHKQKLPKHKYYFFSSTKFFCVFNKMMKKKMNKSEFTLFAQ